MEKRLIDANKLIQDVENLLYKGNPIVAFIQKQVDKQQTVDTTPRWIPCEERLPKEYNPYLVCEEDGECIVHWLEDADWARRMIKNDGIVAWMPLPDPYVGERKDDE